MQKKKIDLPFRQTPWPRKVPTVFAYVCTLSCMPQRDLFPSLSTPRALDERESRTEGALAMVVGDPLMELGFTPVYHPRGPANKKRMLL